MAINHPGVYYKILRNGRPISQIEEDHLESISFRDSYIDGMIKQTSLNFNLSAVSGDTPSTLDNVNFDILYTYIFSQTDIYDIYLGTSEQDSSFMMRGGVFDVAPHFGEDGLITFAVTINNSIFIDPNMIQDEDHAKTYDPGTLLPKVIREVCQDAGLQVFFDGNTESDLSLIPIPNGLSRPTGQTSTGFLQELADEYGVYLNQQADGLHIQKLDLTKRPTLYYKYRPIDPNYDGGVILDFTPELNRPGFYSASVESANPWNGQSGTVKVNATGTPANSNLEDTDPQVILQKNQAATKERENASNQLKITPRSVNYLNNAFVPGANPIQVQQNASNAFANSDAQTSPLPAPILPGPRI
jgi:hypothetical protein